MYREYTEPVLFYGEEGEPASVDALAPDLSILQSMREMKAQEALMGRETLLDLRLTSGGGLAAPKALPAGDRSAPLAASGAQEVRRRRDESGRNWLVQSLSLPGLGQAPSNAVASAMSTETRESGWGWLADTLAGQAGEAAALPKNTLSENEYDPEGSGPVSSDRDAARLAKERAEKEPPTAAAFPERADGMQRSSDRSDGKGRMATSDLPGGDRMASTAMPSDPPAMAEMSRTRQIISKLPVDPQPNFTALKESLAAAPAISAGAGMEPIALQMPARRPALEFPSGAGAAPIWGSSGTRPASGSVPATGSGSTAAGAWQGGWRAQRAAGSIPSRYESPFDPTPMPVAPAATRGATQPDTSSGGYKPAWF